MCGKNRNRFEWPLGVRTNPVYKTSWASLLGNQAITVGSSSSLTWSSYMIGVILIFQSICQKNTFAQTSCLCLINTCQDKSRSVTHYSSANQEFADTSIHRNEQKGVLIAGVPYSLSPISLPFSLPPYPLSMPGLKMGLGNHVLVWNGVMNWGNGRPTIVNNSQEFPPSGTMHVFVTNPVELLSSVSCGRKRYRIGLLSTRLLP